MIARVSSEPAAKPRKYQSALRARQAERTRREILAAAVTLFAGRGWARTTLTAVAEEAGVAVDTVYAAFGSKKALLRAAMDVAIAGDAEPVPLTERDAVTRLREHPPARRLAGVLDIAAAIYTGPVRPLWAALLEAAAGDPEVAQWCTGLEEGRRVTIAEVLELVYDREPDQRTTDIVWCLTSIENYTKLCVERNWPIRQWQDWLSDSIRAVAGPV